MKQTWTNLGQDFSLNINGKGLIPFKLRTCFMGHYIRGFIIMFIPPNLIPEYSIIEYLLLSQM